MTLLSIWKEEHHNSSKMTPTHMNEVIQYVVCLLNAKQHSKFSIRKCECTIVPAYVAPTSLEDPDMRHEHTDHRHSHGDKILNKDSIEGESC